MKEEKDIRQFIVLRAGNSPNEIVNIDLSDFNNGVYKALNIDIYEHVHVGSTFGIDLHMLVDEEGAIKSPLPKVNKQATYLYGLTIYGDVLLCTVEGHAFAPIEGSDFFKLYSYFKKSK